MLKYKKIIISLLITILIILGMPKIQLAAWAETGGFTREKFSADYMYTQRKYEDRKIFYYR